MKISIKTNKIELTPAIEEYATSKIGSLEKFIERFEKMGEAIVEVELCRSTTHHRQGEVYYAEATLNMDGQVFRAEESHEDLRAAIDCVKDTLSQKIKKYKEKKTDYQA